MNDPLIDRFKQLQESLLRVYAETVELREEAEANQRVRRDGERREPRFSRLFGAVKRGSGSSTS